MLVIQGTLSEPAEPSSSEQFEVGPSNVGPKEGTFYLLGALEQELRRLHYTMPRRGYSDLDPQRHCAH